MLLGSKLKNLRLMLGLTQEDLGNRCDLTKGYISQLENDSCSPSISTLEDILSALGTSLHEFFREDIRQIAFRKDDFITKEENNHTITWLIPNSQKNNMEPIILEIQPYSSIDEHSPHEAEEFGYVLNGSIVLHLGDKKQTLKKGETFYYESDKSHYIENSTDKVAKILWITSPPSF